MTTIKLTATSFRMNNRKLSPRNLSVLNFFLKDPEQLVEIGQLVDNLKAEGFTRGLSLPNMGDTMVKLKSEGLIDQPFNKSRIYKIDMNVINRLISEGI